MGDRAAELTARINKTLEKNKAVRERRISKRQKEKPVAELRKEWVAVMRECYELETVPPWSGADFKLAKMLVKECGFEDAVEIVRCFVATWDRRRNGYQERRGDMPSMKVCWNLRGRIVAELEGAVQCPVSKREKVQRGEYDARSAAASPLRGWGD